jgi:hypothetical protein
MGERNHSKGPKEGFHHKYQDIALKGLQMEFEKGDQPFSFFDKTFRALPPIESVEPSELSKVVTVEASADVVFRLQNGVFVNIENQSTYNDANVYRFHLYAALLMDRYGEEMKELYTIVVYTCKPEKNPIDTIKTRNMNFKMYPVFIQEQDGETRFNQIKNKILEEEEVELSKEERLYLVYNPLMEKNATPDERVKEIVEIVSAIEDDEVKFSLLGTMAVMNRKFINEDTKNLIWEAMEMTMVFEKQLKSLEEKQRIEDAKSVLRELYSKGSSDEECEKMETIIKNGLRIPEDTFKEVKEQVKNELAVEL